MKWNKNNSQGNKDNEVFTWFERIKNKYTGSNALYFSVAVLSTILLIVLISASLKSGTNQLVSMANGQDFFFVENTGTAGSFVALGFHMAITMMTIFMSHGYDLPENERTVNCSITEAALVGNILIWVITIGITFYIGLAVEPKKMDDLGYRRCHVVNSYRVMSSKESSPSMYALKNVRCSNASMNEWRGEGD